MDENYKSSLWKENPAPSWDTKERNENYNPYKNRTIIEYGHNSRPLHYQPGSPSNNLQEIRRQRMLESDHRVKIEYKNFEEFEMDRNTSMQRKGDIHDGKSTIVYDNSFNLIPNYKRKNDWLMSPNNDRLMSANNDRLMSANKYQKCSWDRELKSQRILHNESDNINNSIQRSSPSPVDFPVNKLSETSTLDSEIAEILKNDWEFKIQDFEDRVRKEYRNARDYCSKLLDTKGQKTEILEEVEMNPSTLIRRQKDIDYGKNTIGYSNYIKLQSTQEYENNPLLTPNKYQKCSRRSWDGQIKRWRILLHQFDDINSKPKYNTVNSSQTFNVNHREGRVNFEGD